SGVCVDLCTVCPGNGKDNDIDSVCHEKGIESEKLFGVREGRVEILTSALIAHLIKKISVEEDMEKLAFEFHIMIADITVMMCERLAYHPAEGGETGADDESADRREKISNIVLGGGTFVNRILLSRIYTELKKRGYSVYINEKVPCGDGGIALGQLCCREDRS
ncbi:MAG: hypothetical protein J6P16_00335, partial [Eubacterium sp.]|nr:hypothetical protein [Eubacterium sp.]